MCVSSVIVFWEGTEGSANRGDHLHIHKKGDRRECTCYRGIALLSLLEKCMPKVLKEDVERYLNLSWRIPCSGFVLTVVLQTKFSLSNKFSRNLGCMSNFVTILTCDLESYVLTEKVLSKSTSGRDAIVSKSFTM